jgi:Uma2 family endonuclease
MVMPVPLRRFTVDELESFPDDGNRYELLDGVLFVSPQTGLPHQIVATELSRILGTAVENDPQTFIAAPGVVEVGPALHMEPDILIGRLPEQGTRWDAVPEHWLAVEVSGTGSRIYDREYKRDAYLAVGVREVWLVDLERRRISVARPGSAREEQEARVTWTIPGSGRAVDIDIPGLFRRLPHA